MILFSPILSERFLSSSSFTKSSTYRHTNADYTEFNAVSYERVKIIKWPYSNLTSDLRLRTKLVRFVFINSDFSLEITFPSPSDNFLWDKIIFKCNT
jgi:hypothetical protein